MKIKIGILREGKIPHDLRTPFTPKQCLEILDIYKDAELYVQSCDYRSYSNQEFQSLNLNVVDDISFCDILIGIKEVPKTDLIPNKKYMFFSHTIKKQTHNKALLQELIKRKITLMDYECITDAEGNRILGFGRYAGIVGAYNGILGYGKKYDLFQLKPPYLCNDKSEMEEEMKKIRLPNIKILVTGGGRVANGAIETLGALKIRKVTPYEFLNYSFREPVYAQLHSSDYNTAKDQSQWSTEHFYKYPGDYKSTFGKYIPQTDLLIHCAFWDPKAPVLFTLEEMKNSTDFHISVIADITCDINGSIPSTIRPSTIDNAFYGFNPLTLKEDDAFAKNTITVMAVDNLPCELPRDSSEDFGKNLIERVLPSLLIEDKKGIIERATIVKDGMLTPRFSYLEDYVKG